MKNVKIILSVLLSVLLMGCEKVEIEDVPTFDRTEILTFKAYGKDKASVLVGSVAIDAESATIVGTVKADTNMSEVFATCTLTSGSTISPALDGYQDWSSGNRSFTVASASGKRTRTWTITLNKEAV